MTGFSEVSRNESLSLCIGLFIDIPWKNTPSLLLFLPHFCFPYTATQINPATKSLPEKNQKRQNFLFKVTVETWVAIMRGVTVDGAYLFSKTRGNFVCHAQNFEFYPKLQRILNDLNKKTKCLNLCFKRSPGSTKSMTCNTVDGELRSDLETVLLSKEGISSLN